MPELNATPRDFEMARTALLEITSAESIGEPDGFVDEGDGVLSVYLRSELTGYPGWRWTVSIAHIEGFEPTVLETELTPGDGALLAPEWVPWEDRLAVHNAALAADDEADDTDTDDDDDDDDTDDDDDDDSGDDDESDDEDDDDDSDDDVLIVTHSGDVDGVDIDEIDELPVAEEATDDSAPTAGVDEPGEPERDSDDASHDEAADATGSSSDHQ